MGKVHPRIVSRKPATPASFGHTSAVLARQSMRMDTEKKKACKCTKKSRCSGYRYRGRQYISMLRNAISGRKMNMAFEVVPMARCTRLPPLSCSTASQTCLMRGLQEGRFDQLTKSSQLVMRFAGSCDVLAGRPPGF